MCNWNVFHLGQYTHRTHTTIMYTIMPPSICFVNGVGRHFVKWTKNNSSTWYAMLASRNDALSNFFFTLFFNGDGKQTIAIFRKWSKFDAFHHHEHIFMCFVHASKHPICQFIGSPRTQPYIQRHTPKMAISPTNFASFFFALTGKMCILNVCAHLFLYANNVP